MSHTPSAWDSDFPALSGGGQRAPPPAPKPAHAPAPRLSRAERKAQQEEINKSLWNRAENPETFHFLDARDEPPLRSEFKPQMKLLSRKPTPATRPEVEGSMQALSLQRKEDEDSEEENRQAEIRKVKERQELAKKEREEKQRRYEQRRQELFGSGETAASARGAGTGRSSPRGNGRGARGRARTGRGGTGTGTGTPSSNEQSSTMSPAPTPPTLFDPGSSARPENVSWQKRAPSVHEVHPTRQPRGAGSGPGFARGRGVVTS